MENMIVQHIQMGIYRFKLVIDISINKDPESK